MLSYGEMAAEVMRHYAAHDESHGYTQGSGRWGNGGTETVELSDGTEVEVALGDRDCSAGVISAWEAVLPGSTAWATYTGDMRAAFESTGKFRWHPAGSGYCAGIGDVCLSEQYHTAMIVGNDEIAEFSIAEDGTIYGKQEGDQTGYECSIGPYRGGWDGFLGYVGEARFSDQTMVYAQGMLHPLCVRQGVNPPVITGMYDDSTQKAIAGLVERVLSGVSDPTLMADGVIDAQTIAVLDAAPVKGGSQATWALKVALVGCGYRGAEVDGEWRGVNIEDWAFDGAAEAALRRFQTANGLAESGVFDGSTVAALLPLACA